MEEGALVSLQDYSMRLLEKKYDIDGHKEFYLSTVVFQYTQAEPEKKLQSTAGGSCPGCAGSL